MIKTEGDRLSLDFRTIAFIQKVNDTKTDHNLLLVGKGVAMLVAEATPRGS